MTVSSGSPAIVEPTPFTQFNRRFQHYWGILDPATRPIMLTDMQKQNHGLIAFVEPNNFIPTGMAVS